MAHLQPEGKKTELALNDALGRSYAPEDPARILLFPGKLVVDGVVFPVREIREIRISPDRIVDCNSPDVFRELMIRTEKDTVRLRIDYRAGAGSDQQPHWEEYAQFVAALSYWGTKNNVQVTILYMA